MNSSVILRACLLGLAVLVVMGGWQAVRDENDGLQLLFFLFVGIICGVWVIKVVLPRLGDALGTFVYSSGEEVEPNDRMKAAAKLAQGDFKGAIREYEKWSEKDPGNPYPVAEIARIHGYFLFDPKTAVEVLRRELEGRAWPDDAAVFLSLRMVDILAEELHEPSKARQILHQLITDYPNARSRATAQQRLRELDQKQTQTANARRSGSRGEKP